MEDILDSYEWHIFSTEKYNFTIHLPIIILSNKNGLDIFLSNKLIKKGEKNKIYKGYYIGKDGVIESTDKDLFFIDLSITKNVAAMFISIIMILLICLYCSFWYSRNSFNKAPEGIVNVVEMLVEYITESVLIPNLKHKYKKFGPYLLTLFFYILINNIIGLLPASANVTGCISVTACLAFLTFLITNVNGSKTYWKHIFFPHVPKFLYTIMVPIELISTFTKPITLMIRLFANITSGHIILLSIINLGFIFNSYGVGIMGVFINTFMLLLKLLVSFLQAYIFTLLSTMYISDAIKN
jgi:F-type H+-transporting ATPase subunit a